MEPVDKAATGVRRAVYDAAQLAVVIPAYNEAGTIRGIAKAALVWSPLVIVVDDGSADGTADRVEDLPVDLIRMPRNLGKASALVAGFRRALERGAEGVATLDGDGQHRAEDIPKLVDAGQEGQGLSIVIGSRLHQAENFPRARLFGNRVANFWISWAAGHRIADSQSGFRYYPAALLRRLDFARMSSGGFVFESEILIEAAQQGYRTRAVDIPALYDRQAFRASHFRPVPDITRIVLMVAWSLIRRGMYPMGLYRTLCSDGS